MEEQLLRRAKHDAPSALHNRTPSLPLAQNTACGKRRYVGGIGQLFVGNVNFHSAGDFSAYAFGKTDQYPSNSLSGAVRDQGHVGSEEPSQIVPRNQQRILHELGIPCRKFADRLALPDEYPTILHHFCTQKIRRWTGQERRASEYFS